MSAHVELSPSGAYRWVPCPRSVRLSRGVERKSSSYAAKGSAEHKLAEVCLLHGTDAIKAVGSTIQTDEDGTWEITADMATGVQAYLDEVRRWMKHFGPSAKLEVERRVDIESVVPGVAGTADAIVVIPFEEAVVIDYKSGYRWVEADSPQLRIYALGTALAHDVPKVTAVIVQPNAPRESTGEPYWRIWETTTEELLAWAREVLLPAAEMVDRDDAPIKAGNHCHYCPVKARCPELRKQSYEQCKVWFDDEVVPAEPQEITLPLPATLDTEQLRKVMASLDMVKDWYEAVREHTYNLLLTGAITPEEVGYKVVAGKLGNRKWDDEAAVKGVLLDRGVPGDVWQTEPQLKSPTQLEKALKATVQGDLWREISAAHVTREEGKPALAIITDKRPALRPASDLFEIEAEQPDETSNAAEF